MYQKVLEVLGILVVMLLASVANAGVIAQIDLKDGSRVIGEIVEMTEG